MDPLCFVVMRRRSSLNGPGLAFKSISRFAWLADLSAVPGDNKWPVVGALGGGCCHCQLVCDQLELLRCVTANRFVGQRCDDLTTLGATFIALPAVFGGYRSSNSLELQHETPATSEMLRRLASPFGRSASRRCLV